MSAAILSGTENKLINGVLINKHTIPITIVNINWSTKKLFECLSASFISLAPSSFPNITAVAELNPWNITTQICSTFWVIVIAATASSPILP